MKLIIVESPNKVKTIKGFLSKDYIVTASVGHCLEIANTGKYQLGIDVENDFHINYIISENKKDIVKKLKQLVKQSTEVIFATDNDREGYAIAWHLYQILDLKNKVVKRVVFNEITKKCVLEALQNPVDFNLPLVTAAETRACVDKIIGYRVSPVLMQYVRGKSAGRVQSATLSLLVDKEKEILNFKPVTYYDLVLNYLNNNTLYQAKYVTKERLTNEAVVRRIISECKHKNYRVINIESKNRQVPSKAPFTTSTFQQECSSKLGIPPEVAMGAAQKLFEGIDVNGQHQGIITYIRTDSSRMDPDFKKNLYTFINNNFGSKYVGVVKELKSKSKEQDAHECLRCVDLSITPEILANYITDNKLIDVYILIYARTIASAMSNAVMVDTTITIENNGHLFTTVGHKLKFDGFKRIYGYTSDDDEDEDSSLPKVQIGDKIDDQDLISIEKQTQPPKRYSQASLIKAMEESGIGRPSTYASCIAILKEKSRNYTIVEKGSIRPTQHGIEISDYLQEHFNSVVSVKYTSELETKLDEIADSKIDKLNVLKEFYSNLCDTINILRSTAQPANVELVGRKCPECGCDLIYKISKKNVKFIGCSNYPTCKHVEWINDPKKEQNLINANCPQCGRPLVKRINKKNGKAFIGCSGYPSCTYLTNEMNPEIIKEETFLQQNIYDKD